MCGVKPSFKNDSNQLKQHYIWQYFILPTFWFSFSAKFGHYLHNQIRFPETFCCLNLVIKFISLWLDGNDRLNIIISDHGPESSSSLSDGRGSFTLTEIFEIAKLPSKVHIIPRPHCILKDNCHIFFLSLFSLIKLSYQKCKD